MTIMQRRDFLKNNLSALGGALLAGAWPVAAPAAGQSPRPVQIEPGIKLGMRLPPGLGTAELNFLSQLGLTWCRLDLNGEDAAPDRLAQTRDTYQDAGVRIYTVMNRGMRHPALLEGGPERDRQLDQLADFIALLGRLEIPTWSISWNGLLPNSQVYSTGRAEMDGLSTRVFDLAEYRLRDRPGERRWSADEVRAAFKYMMDRLLPVAESAGVRIAVHPDDPPIPEQGGVARIFYSLDHYRQAFELCDSPNLGILLCIGTWAEAGRAVTELDPADAVRWFGSRGRLIDIHFRNVRGTLPRFQETFMDNGDVDLQGVMDALVEVGYDGLVVPDHIPAFGIDGDLARTLGGGESSPLHPAGLAYSAGCMRVYLNNAMRRAGLA